MYKSENGPNIAAAKKQLILKGYDTSKEVFREYNKSGKIVRLGIHVSHERCNLSCPYCLNSDDGFHYIDNHLYQSRASLPEMKKWISDAKQVGVRTVVIDGLFEPMMNKECTLNLIRHIRDEGVNPILITNLVLLAREDVIALADCDCAVLGKLNVPLVGAQDPRYQSYVEVQRYLTGNNYADIYEKLRSKIELLQEYNFNSQRNNAEGNPITNLGLQTVIAPQNIAYIPELYRQLSELNIYMHMEPVKMQGGGYGDTFNLSPCSIKDLWARLKAVNDERNVETMPQNPAYVLHKCLNNLATLNININGDVIPCPSIEVIVGNLRSDLMPQIIRHRHMQMIRNLEKHLTGSCQECELLRSADCYGGCRGGTFMRLRQIGHSVEESLSASDPSCWRVNKVLDLRPDHHAGNGNIRIITGIEPVVDADCVIGSTATILKKYGVENTQALFDAIFGRHFEIYYHSVHKQVDAYRDKMALIESNAITYQTIPCGSIKEIKEQLDRDLPILCISDYHYLTYLDGANKRHKLHAFIIYGYDLYLNKIHVCDPAYSLKTTIYLEDLLKSINSKKVQAKCFIVKCDPAELRLQAERRFSPPFIESFYKFHSTEQRQGCLLEGVKAIEHLSSDMFNDKDEITADIDPSSIHLIHQARERHRRYLIKLQERDLNIHNGLIESLNEHNKNWEILGNLCIRMTQEKHQKYSGRIKQRVKDLIEGERQHAYQLHQITAASK